MFSFPFNHSHFSRQTMYTDNASFCRFQLPFSYIINTIGNSKEKGHCMQTAKKVTEKLNAACARMKRSETRNAEQPISARRPGAGTAGLTQQKSPRSGRGGGKHQLGRRRGASAALRPGLTGPRAGRARPARKAAGSRPGAAPHSGAAGAGGRPGRAEGRHGRPGPCPSGGCSRDPPDSRRCVSAAGRAVPGAQHRAPPRPGRT